jgi:hypothetical protein
MMHCKCTARIAVMNAAENKKPVLCIHDIATGFVAMDNI